MSNLLQVTYHMNYLEDLCISAMYFRACGLSQRQTTPWITYVADYKLYIINDQQTPMQMNLVELDQQTLS